MPTRQTCPLWSFTGSTQVRLSRHCAFWPSGLGGNAGPPPVHDMPPPMSWSNVTVISVSSGSTSFAPTAGEVAIILGGACALLPAGDPVAESSVSALPLPSGKRFHTSVQGLPMPVWVKVSPSILTRNLKVCPIRLVVLSLAYSTVSRYSLPLDRKST